jgi:hypothetical protein
VTLSVRDSAYAITIGVVALGLYVATLQPDFGGPEDTPKFQFIGHVLGTPHPPGYPLYVLLSHLFVKLPLGTIAYRANLFSGVMAAVACALTYLIGRQIGSSRWPALCAALGLAAGASFWRSAVFAEVYSLAAVTVALTAMLLLSWRARSGPGRLLAAIAAFALGLGNHLIIVGLAPACVLYVLLRDVRALNARLVAGAFLIMLLGVSQYGFIVLRSRQEAPYLESRASSLSELVSVVTAERYAEQRFAFNPSVLLTEHVPAVASVIGRELRISGVLLLAAGLLYALRSRNAGAMFLTAGAAGMLAMVVNLSGDLKGFITPVMVLLWPLAGLGIGAVSRVLESTRMHRRIASAISIVVAAAMPVSNLAANYADADQSHATGAGTFLRSVYRQLPERAGVVAEDYFYDMAAHYFPLTGEAGGDRRIARVRFDAAAVREAARGTGSINGGHRIFAFAGAATFLGAEGLHFDRTMVVGPSLDEWLENLPDGTVIVGSAAYVAVPAEFSSRARRVGRARSFTAFALATGRAGGAWREEDSPIALAIVEPGVHISSLPAFGGAVRAFADDRHARIEVAGRTIAQVDAGLALAVFAKDGTFLRAIEFPSGEPLQVPFEEALYELKAEAACVDVTTDKWSDITPALSTGSWLTTLRTFGSVTIESAIAGGFGSGPRSSVLVGDGSAQSVPHDEVLLTELTRTGERRPVFRLALDRAPVGARARLRSGGAQSHITVCAHLPHSLFVEGRDQAVLRPDFESEAYFGAGWTDAERTATGPVRRAGRHATLLLPFEEGYRYRMSFEIVGTAAAGIDVTVNGVAAATCDLRENGPCEVDLLPAIVRDGLNTLTLTARGPEPPGHGPVLTFRGGRLRRFPGR